MRKNFLLKVMILIIILSFNFSIFVFASYDKSKNIIITPQNIAITNDTNNITLETLGKLVCEGAHLFHMDI